MCFLIPLGVVTAILMFLLLILLSYSLIVMVSVICVSLIFGLLIDRYVEDRLKELKPLS